MADDPRCVLWTSDSEIPRGANRLYLSSGAVAAAAEVGIPFLIARDIAAEDLPEDRSLLIGLDEGPDHA